MALTPSTCAGNPRLVGDPVDVVTGVQTDVSFDFRLRGPVPIAWNRYYSSARRLEPLPLGFGHTHQYDHRLTLDLDGASYRGPTGDVTEFPELAIGRNFARAGLLLTRRADLDYHLTLPRGDRLEFMISSDQDFGPVKQFVRGDQVATFMYDTNGLLAEIIDPLKRFLLVTSDQCGRISEITLVSSASAAPSTARSKVLVSYDYDSAGNLARVTDAHGFTQSLQYNSRHLLTRRTDRKGYSFLFAYDEQGRCTHSRGDDGLFEVHLEFYSQAKATYVRKGPNPPFTYLYDDFGALTQITDPYGAATQFVRDEEGRIVQEIDPGGNVTALHYDSTGRHDYRVDPNGHRLPTRADDADPLDPLATLLPQTPLEWEFGNFIDAKSIQPPRIDDPVLELFPAPVVDTTLGRRIAFYENPLNPSAGDGNGESLRLNDVDQPIERSSQRFPERWKYDPNGNEIEHDDRDGSVWKGNFGSWNCLRERVDPLGNITSFENNSSGLFTKIVDPGGVSIEYEYDYNDRLVGVRRQGDVLESYVRDKGGNIVGKQDSQGRTSVTWEMGVGNVDKVRTLSSGEKHEFEHDGQGRILVIRGPAGDVTFTYDDEGGTVSDKRNGLGVIHELDNGWLVGTSYFDKFVVDYFNEDNGDRVIVDPTGGNHRFQRSASGLIVKRLRNGTRELCQFDRAGRCLRKSVVRDTTTATPWIRIYAYSAVGNLIGIGDTTKGQWNYTYDAAHRLTEERTPGRAPRRFAFDVAGNLLMQPGLSSVTVDPANRLTAANGDRFEYDGRDRLSARIGALGTRRYMYDDLDMLVECHIDGEVWTATYDPFGRRVTKNWQGRTTTYFWDDSRLAAELRHDGSVRLYVYADRRCLVPFLFVEYSSRDAKPSSGHAYAVFANQVGVPIRVEDAEGKACWTASGDPFGQVEIGKESTIEMPLRFPGHYCDAETGLHFNRFRYFSPELGRYLQPDPAGQIGGINLFAYPVNPLIDVDLDGLGGKAKTSTTPKQQKPPKPPKPCPYDLSNPENQALLQKPLDQMSPDELKKYAVLRAKELQAQHVGDNKFADNGITTAVTIVEDQDGKRRAIVTTSTEDRKWPKGMKPKDGETFADSEPHLKTVPVKDENGQPVMTPATKNGKVVLDENGEAADWKEDKQTINKKTGEPYDKDTQSDHHAEQRGMTAVNDANQGKSNEDKEKIAAMGPSKPCCAGCQKALRDSGNLDAVDKDQQGKPPKDS